MCNVLLVYVMRILIINGPNLNLLGQRRPEIYGEETFLDTLDKLRQRFGDVDIDYFQSNCEGKIIDRIQEDQIDGIVINPGAYAHYSHAIADTIEGCPLPVVEVHISNIFAREEFRAKAVTGRCANAVIAGCGRNGYALAIEQIIHLLNSDAR